MAKRTHALACTSSATTTAADRLWADVTTGAELLQRVRALPGFGDAKARIFVGLLGKRLGVRPPGWDTAAADWPSIADVDSFERVPEIRERKRARKAAKQGGEAKSGVVRPRSRVVVVTTHRPPGDRRRHSRCACLQR